MKKPSNCSSATNQHFKTKDYADAAPTFAHSVGSPQRAKHAPTRQAVNESSAQSPTPDETPGWKSKMGDTIMHVLMAIYGAAILFAFWVALKK